MKKQEIKNFLYKIVRIRRRLMALNKSKKMYLQMVHDTDFIRVHLDNNNYSARGLAKFFLRHQERIKRIIPGTESRSHQKLMKEHHRILFHCDMIINDRDKAMPCLNKAMPFLKGKEKTSAL